MADNFEHSIALARLSVAVASVHATAMVGVKSKRSRKHSEWYMGFMLEQARVFQGAALRSAHLDDETRHELEDLWSAARSLARQRGIDFEEDDLADRV